MLLGRKLIVLIAMLAGLSETSASVEAKEIKFFVVARTGLYEISNTSTGGRFVIAAR